MREGWRYWTVTGLAGLALVLALVNMVLSEINRGLQASVTARAQYLQQSGQLEGLGREIEAAIARRAVQAHDAPLRAILETHGIRITPPETAAPGVGPTPAPPRP